MCLTISWALGIIGLMLSNSRGIFRTHSKFQDGAFLRKQLTASGRYIFLPENSMVDVRLGSKYTSEKFFGIRPYSVQGWFIKSHVTQIKLLKTKMFKTEKCKYVSQFTVFGKIWRFNATKSIFNPRVVHEKGHACFKYSTAKRSNF